MNVRTWLGRQFRADPLPPLLLALAAALVAALLVLGPRLIGDVGTRALTGSLDSLSALQGDVATRWRGVPTGQLGGDPPGDTYLAGAEALRAAQPAPLRDLLTAPQFSAELGSPRSTTPPVESGYYKLTFALLVDPALDQHATLVAGSWPAAPAVDGEGPAEVVLLHDAADRLGWEPGHEPLPGLRLSGTYRPSDPDASRWQHVPRIARFAELNDPNLGMELSAALVLHPAALDVGVGGDRPQILHQLWFGLDVASLRDGVDINALSQHLTGLLTRTHDLSAPGESGPHATARFSSELGGTLDAVRAQQRTFVALFVVLASGPLAISLLLFGLAITLLVARRVTSTRLLTARGASRSQLTRAAAIEAAALVLPGAALGHLAATLLLPRGGLGWQWGVTALAALLLGSALPLAQNRVDSGVGRSRSGGSRLRLAVETLLAGIAAAATWQLVSRSGVVGGDVDLLGAAAPVLLTVAAGAALWRLYPYPLRALARWLRGRRELPALLGVLRAIRTPVGGAVPLVAVVLGTSVAVLGSLVSSSLEATTSDAAWRSNGAEVRVTGPWMTDELVARIRAVDGVTHVARIHRLSDGLALDAATGREHVSLWVAEPELLDVYATTPYASALPSTLFGAESGLVVGGAATTEPGQATLQGVGDVTVLGYADALPGAPTQESWAVMSTDAARAAGVDPGFATLALIGVEPGGDAVAVASTLRDQLAAGVVTTAADQLEGWHVPASRAFVDLVSGLGRLTLGLMVLAALGAQVADSRARRQTLALLRTLGASPSQRRRVVAWETGPVLAIAMVAGSALGWGLAALLLATADFGFITGTSSASLAGDWRALAGIAGLLVAAFVLIVGGGASARTKEDP